MNRWAIYNSDGQIDRIYFGSELEATVQKQGNEKVISIPESLDDSTAYIIGNEVLPKQAFTLQINKLQILSDGEDTAVISGIPLSTTIKWPDDQSDIITDGEVRFAVDLPGMYTLKFSAIPYLDREVVIEAIAAT